MPASVIKGNFISAPVYGEIEIRKNAYMVLIDGKIDGIYDALPEKYKGIEICDYKNALIMQSFADMHLHAPQYPMLGLGMDLPLLEWLNTYTFNNEAKFADIDYAREVYSMLSNELASRGTTRVCMFSSLHADSTLILMNELEKAGITGYVGKVNMDRNGGSNLQETAVSSIKDTIYWLDRCDFKGIKPIITPRFTPSCSDALMDELGKIAEARGLYVQSHLSESISEQAWVKNLSPDCSDYWKTYFKHGLWKEKTVMAHCVYCSDEELEAIKQYGVYAVHCPDSNVNLCSGTAPVKKMLEMGINVILGSDIAGGADISMTNVITQTIRASKIKHMETDGKYDFLTVKEAYYLGTSAGHAYFGDKPGFAAGNMLHAVVIDDSDYNPPQYLTLEERFERSLYLSEKHNIIAVYSDGRKIK